MPMYTVELTEHDESFIKDCIATGRFSNTSEAVRAGLHLLDEQQAEEKAKLEWLRDATLEAFAALDRGEGIRLSSVEDIDALVHDAVEEMRAARRTTHA